MKTKNHYHIPIELARVTKVAKEGVAHVGDLIHSIDYDAPEGTPILAALDGVVIAIKQDSDQGGDDPKYENDGNYIEILHENDEVSEYEHILQHSAKVKIGDVVKKGQVIASVGNTGWSECPHLHFMVYPKGEEYKTLEIQFEKTVSIGKGNLAGKGVYAVQNFKKGDVVILYNLEPLTEDEYLRLSDSEKMFTHSHKGQMYLYGEPERFVNHSDKPNTLPNEQHTCDIAVRDIMIGEEITTDSSQDDFV